MACITSHRKEWVHTLQSFNGEFGTRWVNAQWACKRVEKMRSRHVSYETDFDRSEGITHRVP